MKGKKGDIKKILKKWIDHLIELILPTKKVIRKFVQVADYQSMV
jgi:hypothetical protein